MLFASTELAARIERAECTLCARDSADGDRGAPARRRPNVSRAFRSPVRRSRVRDGRRVRRSTRSSDSGSPARRPRSPSWRLLERAFARVRASPVQVELLEPRRSRRSLKLLTRAVATCSSGLRERARTGVAGRRSARIVRRRASRSRSAAAEDDAGHVDRRRWSTGFVAPRRARASAVSTSRTLAR